MKPYLNFGSLELPSYAVLVFSGLLLGIIISVIRAKKLNLDRLNVVLSSVFIVIGLLFGAKILFAITTLPEIFSHLDLLKEYPAESIGYMFSGFVFFGGLLGALLFLKMFAFQFNQPFWKYIDLFVPIFPLVHAIGRVGCFLAGCCYGVEWHGICSVTYPDDAIVEGVNLVSRFPVQILESILNLGVFISLIIYSRTPRREGNVLGIYLISYSIIRFFVEFLRNDSNRGHFLGISTSQWIGLILIPVGIYIIKRKNKNNEGAI